MILLERTCDLLEQHGVPHALIGGLALASAGVARSTFDIDLLATDSRVLIPAFWAAVRDEGGLAEVRCGVDGDPFAGVVRLETMGARPVDVMVGREPWMTRAIARAVRLGDGPPIVQAHDLVLLKLFAGGTHDVWDIHALLALPTAPSIVAQVEADLEALPPALHERWTEARRVHGAAER